MQTLLTIESTSRRGTAQRTQRRLSELELTIGRSTRAQIHLPDPRVALEHARITVAEDAATLVAQGGRLRINGRASGGARLAPGDRVEIGPFIVRVDAPPAGVALALTVQPHESAVPAQDHPLERLMLRRRSVSKRRLSYLGFIGIVLIFLAVPLAWDAIQAFGLPGPLRAQPALWHEVAQHASNRMLRSWDPGTLSRSHQIFRDDCRACHQVQDHDPFVSQLPFVTQVMDQACLACHKNLSEHVPRASLTGTELGRRFADTRCAACHRDHKDQRMAPRLDALCATCHQDIQRITPDAASRDVTDFLADHPRFRVSLLDADSGALTRVRLGEPMQEKSNLKFNHKLHLDRAGVRSPAGRKQLGCDSCHEPADDGRLIAPVSMERHCRECHSLKFDCSREKSGAPLECRSGAREVPHGPVEVVAATLREFYARHALGDAPPDAQAPPDLPRVRPGMVLTYEDRQPVLAAADRAATRVLNQLFEQLNVCGTCHHARPSAQAPGWEIAPIRFAQVWMPAARFTHAKHTTMRCGSCHAVGESTDARDIAMPDVDSCRECHVGGKPVLGKVTSDCASCHKFHGGAEVWNHILQAQAKARRAIR